MRAGTTPITARSRSWSPKSVDPCGRFQVGGSAFSGAAPDHAGSRTRRRSRAGGESAAARKRALASAFAPPALLSTQRTDITLGIVSELAVAFHEGFALYFAYQMICELSEPGALDWGIQAAPFLHGYLADYGLESHGSSCAHRNEPLGAYLSE
jgi:hypothetical protein